MKVETFLMRQAGIVVTHLSSHRDRTREMNGRIGSLSDETSRCILSSRIMKFVAHVSSSRRSALAPASRPSIIDAAWSRCPVVGVVYH